MKNFLVRKLTGKISTSMGVKLTMGYAYWHPEYIWARIWITHGVNGGWQATEWLSGCAFTCPAKTHRQAFENAIERLECNGREKYEKAVEAWTT